MTVPARPQSIAASPEEAPGVIPQPELPED